jgi:hypothetical protein
MHALAADDGTNSDYSSAGMPPGGFPVLQSSPLANHGSTKGGPFSEGCHAVRAGINHNYATLSISKVGQSDGPCIAYRGYEAGSEEPRIRFEKCGQLGGVDGKEGGGAGPKCSIQLAETWVYVVGCVLLLALLGVFGFIIIVLWRRRRNQKTNATVA